MSLPIYEGLGLLAMNLKVSDGKRTLSLSSIPFLNCGIPFPSLQPRIQSLTSSLALKLNAQRELGDNEKEGLNHGLVGWPFLIKKLNVKT